MYNQPRIRDEMKTHDKGIAHNFNITNDNGQITMLNEVPQGNSSLSRIGKRIIMKALQMRGRINVASATAVNSKVCVLLIYVRSVNSTGSSVLPNPSEILTAANSFALTNRNYASKFKILRRWDYVVAGSSADPNERSKHVFEEYIVFKKPLVTQWLSGTDTGVYATTEKGALLLMCLGDTATDSPSFSATARLYFNESDGYVY